MNRGGAETPSEERQLNLAEITSEATRLIGLFKEALRVAPEFSRTLVDGYLSEEPDDRNHFGHEPIKITRGGFRYSIDYGAIGDFNGRLSQELVIIREPSGVKLPGDLTEMMDLLVKPDNSAIINFKRGKRDSHKFWYKEGLELHLSTPTAISQVEGFLVDFQQGV